MERNSNIKKGYRIISLEAKDIYEQEQKNGIDAGYILPPKKSWKFFQLFKNNFDYSLELIELNKSYYRICRNKISFNDEYQNNYTLSVINLKFNYIYEDGEKSVNLQQLRKHFYSNGFNLGGVHYVRYKRSSGSSRQGNCLFINEKLFNHMTKWGECGLSSNIGDLASWEAYKALSLSSLKGTINIPLDGILFIEDYKSEFEAEVVNITESNGRLSANTSKTKIENVIWDGESLLDESLFTGDYADKHMLLLRNKFFKSCAFKTSLQKWFEEKNITIKSLQELGFITFAKDIKQIVMVTTISSMKFLKFSNDKCKKTAIKEWVRNVDDIFGVVKYDKRTKFFDGDMVQSSYQLINTLGLDEEKTKSLIAPSIQYIDTIRKDYDFMRYHFSDAYKREKEQEDELISDGLAERGEVIFKLMDVNYPFKNTKLYIDFRDDVIDNQKSRLKKGHILLPGTNATLFGNGPEMLLALSGDFDLNNKCNEAIFLKKGEIACQFFRDGERLVCARSPHITMGNLYCVKNNLSSGIWEYFDLGNNIVCVNAIKENIQQRLNGCDYDSDSMLITNDEIVVDNAFKQTDVFKVPNCGVKSNKISNIDLAKLDHKTSNNLIGDIVNLSQILNSIIWDKINKGKAFEETQKIYEDACKLAVLSGIEIDKAKRSYSKINVSLELDALRKKYRKERPYFFKIIDDEEIDRRTRNIKDKSIKAAKIKEIRQSRHYIFYQTTMDFVYKITKEIDYRKGKPKESNYESLIDIIKLPTNPELSTYYETRDRIIDICEKYKEKISKLYLELKQANGDEKEVIYSKIKEIKEERKIQINSKLTNEYIIYLVLKKYECKNGENWLLLAPLLDNEIFLNMLKSSKEKLKRVVRSDQGEYKLYGINFAKK